MIILKKLLSIIIAACIIASIFCVTTGAADTSTLTTAEKSILKLKNADADNDGNYTTEDVRALLRAAAGIDEDSENYDVDLDGATSVSDALTVLKATVGIGNIISTEEALELFNARVNRVKSLEKEADGETPIAGALPGFEKTRTMQCTSMKVTTSGAPSNALLGMMGLPGLNVTDMPYEDYIDRVVTIMTSDAFSAELTPDKKEQLDFMQKAADEMYDPKSQTDVVDAGVDVDHISLYPISNQRVSSKLTTDDVKSVSCTMTGGNIIYTVKMNDYTYVGDEYPTGSTGFQGRLKLPYGKIFDIMSFDESDGSTLNSVTYKNGLIVLTENASTGMLINASYSYAYKSSVSAAPQDDLKMKTDTESTLNDTFIFNQ